MGKNSRANNKKLRKSQVKVPATEEECQEMIAYSFVNDMMHVIGKGNRDNAIKTALEDEEHLAKCIGILERFLEDVEKEGTRLFTELELYEPGPRSSNHPGDQLMRLKLIRELAMEILAELQPRIRVLDDKYPNACVPECK